MEKLWEKSDDAINALADCSLFDTIVKDLSYSYTTSYPLFNEHFLSSITKTQYLDIPVINYALISYIVSFTMPCEFVHNNLVFKKNKMAPQVLLISTNKIYYQHFYQMAEYIFLTELNQNSSEKKNSVSHNFQITKADLAIYCKEAIKNIHCIEVTNEIELGNILQAIPNIISTTPQEHFSLVVVDYYNLFFTFPHRQYGKNKLKIISEIKLDPLSAKVSRMIEESFDKIEFANILVLKTAVRPFERIAEEDGEISIGNMMDVVTSDDILYVCSSNGQYSQWLSEKLITLKEGCTVYIKKDSKTKLVHILCIEDCETEKYYVLQL